MYSEAAMFAEFDRSSDTAFLPAVNSTTQKISTEAGYSCGYGYGMGHLTNWLVNGPARWRGKGEESEQQNKNVKTVVCSSLTIKRMIIILSLNSLKKLRSQFIL